VRWQVRRQIDQIRLNVDPRLPAILHQREQIGQPGSGVQMLDEITSSSRPT
jgi:hypothetical protein